MAFNKQPVILSDSTIEFPDPRDFDEHGLVAVGGQLSLTRIIDAYHAGIFPWFEQGQPILWWSPDPRMILYPDAFRITHSLKKSLKKFDRLSFDTDFEQVIYSCATSNGRVQNTWITDPMIQAYCHLHQQGYAHSVEVWLNNKLVGGLYGISLGHAFFGESMFHTQTDASKVAMYYLTQQLNQFGFDFIDCQLPTPHLESLGGIIISRDLFLKKLALTLSKPSKIGKWIYS